MNKTILSATLAILVLAVIGCHKPQQVHISAPDYDRPLLPGQPALRKITNLAEIPDFTDAGFNLANLSSAIDNSLNYLKKPRASGSILARKSAMSR